MPRDELFQTMDQIANAVSDSCEPQLVPEIEPYTVNGKSIIIVTVSPQPQRPYYLKSKGKEKGTYIRVGATTRLASLEKIKELGGNSGKEKAIMKEAANHEILCRHCGKSRGRRLGGEAGCGK